MSLYLGIDFGTSGARAAVIDQEMRLCVQVSQRFASVEPHQWATQWQDVLFSLIGQIPADIRAQICAIAIDGTSSTVLLCNRAGVPLDTPILYNDARAGSALADLQVFFAQANLHDAPGQGVVLSATSSLVKLLWWKQQPIYSQARYLLHQADWLAFLLHGQLGVSDYHNCLKLGYDVARLEYPSWMAGLDVMPLLPQVRSPGSVVGTIVAAVAHQLGLPINCQICTGTTDSIAAFLASGITEIGEAVTSLGSTLVLKLLSATPIENGTYGIYSHRLGDLWLVGGASNTGGAVLQQFFTPQELLELSPHIPVQQESPLKYYPLTQLGDRFPINDPALLPCLEPRPASPVDFLHGLLESMARIEARGYQLLQELGATNLVRVYTAGGGAANPSWTAIRSRQLQVPVLVSPNTEAAYGTARLAKSSRE
ncbi:FGGY-family carbohydrate kinase [Phormidium sp. CLA17]|uniref:FGGY-family carbohydrate kinase n=1 Tax=Leptolyngbya sp. Cla-17 TaxID=2803751 RepID=UPI0014911A85|nr:FGGY-family carbohydrate kinase [Leptolyngbya sp. Cla-17]MBM0741488.1 FGGY-family carbohydrate kinase [Leptolyngbya sp. Cla-17]